MIKQQQLHNCDIHSLLANYATNFCLQFDVIADALLHRAVTFLTDVTMYWDDMKRYSCMFIMFIAVCCKDSDYEQTYLCFVVSLVDIDMSCH